MTFVSGFGDVTRQERQRADLFYESLTGVRVARPISASRSYETYEEPPPSETFAESSSSTSYEELPSYEAAEPPDAAVPEQAVDAVQLVEPFRLPLDAAIVWPNGKAYFFKGDRYVRYSIDPEGVDSGYPKKIKDHWPRVWERDIDAVVIWNESTAYFFKGDEFIKYAIKGAAEGGETGYPKKIKDVWKGLWERDIDAAVVLSDGAYFLKGDQYIRYPVGDPIEQQKADAPKRILDKWPKLSAFTRGIDAALIWPDHSAYFFKCGSYIHYHPDGRAYGPLAITEYWKGLVGAPSSWRLGRVPPRPKDAKKGRAFFEDVLFKLFDSEKAPRATEWVKRENAMVAELIAGNIPRWLLQWVEIKLSHTPNTGPAISGTIRVLPDYLAIGKGGDYVYVPLDPWSAQRVASTFGVLLPTARICHAIWEQTPATHRIGAIPFDYWQQDLKLRRSKPGRAQNSTAAYLEHSDAIRAKTAGITRGELIAGHKKDVVLSACLNPQDGLFPTSRKCFNSRFDGTDNSAFLAYHGFYSAGIPVEPCNHLEGGALDPRCVNKDCKDGTTSCLKNFSALGHEMQKGTVLFSDYSQGVRFVHPRMVVDGKERCVAHVLAHPRLCYLISSEGPILSPRIPKPTKKWLPEMGI